MTSQEFLLPDVGEGLTEAEIVRWRVSVGDTVDVNDLVVDIETAKAIVELPCPFAGVISALLVDEGRVVPVGTAILAVTSDQREPVLIGYGVMTDSATTAPVAAPTVTKSETPRGPAAPGDSGNRVLAKPPVRLLARERGVDLQTVTPTGPHGDVTRGDVEQAVAGDISADVTATAPQQGERIPVRGVKRSMALAMVRSVTQAPQVSIWKDVDMRASMEMLEVMRGHTDFANIRLTPLTLTIAAMVHGVKQCPEMNARWHERGDGEAEIELRRDVNIGVAVAGPRGLVVPVLRDADRCSTREIAQRLIDLTGRAREDRLSPQDSLGATVTVTNIGVFDVDGGTPMLPPEQSGIVAMGRIMDRPWVVSGGLAVRPIMQLSVTFDHRIVDGATGSIFLTEVANFLTDPSPALLGV